MKYGVAFFLHIMKTGKKSIEIMASEWVGPRCCKPGISKSMSDMMEAANNKGMFTFAFRSLDVALPVMYPRAKWPTANV